MAPFSIPLLSLFIVLQLELAISLEIRELKNACSTCIQTSPRFWYSCNTCYDNPDQLSYCGYTVNQLLQCPRGNKLASYCHNALINDALIGAFESNHYQMEPGDSCMVVIQNGIYDEENTIGYWKIWKEQKDLQFFMAPSLTSVDDNELQKIAHPGDVEEIKRGEKKYLFVTNPTMKRRSFKLNFAGAHSLQCLISKHLFQILTLTMILIYF